MIIYVQWATLDAQDYIALDVRRDQQVRTVSKKAVPGPGSILDNLPGWINSINCQGIEFFGYDHTAVQVDGNGLIITGWQDDPEDFPPGTRYATRWNLQPPAPDPNIGGQINTVQTRTLWAESGAGLDSLNPLPWSQFVLPPTNQTFHGIWLTPEQFEAHRTIRTPHGWREWI